SERSTGQPHQLTHLDISEEQQKKVGETRSVSWEFNGKTLYGTIWLPANYREGQRCPTIVDVYPGSQASGMRNVFRGDPFSDDVVWQAFSARGYARSEEHTSELQSRENLVCRLLLEKKKKHKKKHKV